MSSVRTAVFPVGGLGTRFLPATKAVPKEMLPVVDKPLIQYAVEEARDAGIEHFVFVTRSGKSAVEDHFDRNFELETVLGHQGRHELLPNILMDGTVPGRLAYVRQMDPLGLGHAVWCARHLIGNGPFAVLLADELLRGDRPPLADLIDVHEDTGGNVVSVIEVGAEDTGSYGIVDPGKIDGRRIEVKGLVEKPDPADAPSSYAIAGRYILQPEIMGLLGEGHIGAGGEIQLTDAMVRLIGGQPFDAVIHEGSRYDCGSKVGLLEANVALALERDDLDGVESAVRRALGE
ncbi:MAG: UTP--glucose-1-phosphate uridylyltransferase GalU [Acidimicrobiia bacterium]|nr:MAG: UTP--glucose-1-phosphate uridylyltransferase GalU [Acidimicrobiia bacterium]